MKKIAIIGSGISGLSCAFFLYKDYDITLFEKNNYIGGHANTVTICYDDHSKKIDVDTGFIVFNHYTYPNLTQLFKLLDVQTVKSNMSFGIKDTMTNIEYSSNGIAGIFAQKKNITNRHFLRMLFDIVKFNQKSKLSLENDSIDQSITLEEYIRNLKTGQYFVNYYLLPMVSAIWSCSIKLVKNFPAKVILHFFYNHGLLDNFNRPQWYTVKDGSKNYVEKISHTFKHKIRLNTKVSKVFSQGHKVVVKTSFGEEQLFDEVIFASNPGQTRNMITDLTLEENDILSQFKCSTNNVILHKDSTLMPNSHKAWSSWSYTKTVQNETTLTYWMNNLQNIDKQYPLFVSLNSQQSIDKALVFSEHQYEHPVLDNRTVCAQIK